MKSYKNKFLDKIGYPSKESTSSFVFGMKDDRRAKRWKDERKKWGGFDSRVAWNLNTFLLESLYTWLNIYLKRADKVVDLTYHKFQIHGEQLTQRECVVRMIADLKFALSNLDDDTMSEKVHEKVKDCFYILGECCFSLWY